MNRFERHLQIGIAAAVILVSGFGAKARADGEPYRFHSPSGKFDIIVQPLSDDWTHVKKAQDGVAKESMKQFGIDFYPVKSSGAVNSIIYSDLDPPMSPADLVGSMIWSPNEEFVALPDRQKARVANHVPVLAASLSTNKLWSLEADHVQWVDDHRFVGDIKTKEIPGAIIEFDGLLGKAEVLIQPENGIGFQIAAVSGKRVTVKEILNDFGSSKTTWEKFTPACFDLDLDTLKKRSIACP